MSEDEKLPTLLANLEQVTQQLNGEALAGGELDRAIERGVSLAQECANEITTRVNRLSAEAPQ